MTINEKQQDIIDEFSQYEEWMDKYEYIIQLAKDLPIIDEQYKKDEYLIKGCQSRVWLHADYRDEKIYFTADSDAIITKGLVAMMVDVLSEQSPQAIVDAEIYFIDKIGLKNHLSPTRSNGLLAMLKQMKLYATALSLKNSAH